MCPSTPELIPEGVLASTLETNMTPFLNRTGPRSIGKNLQIVQMSTLREDTAPRQGKPERNYGIYAHFKSDASDGNLLKFHH